MLNANKKEFYLHFFGALFLVGMASLFAPSNASAQQFGVILDEGDTGGYTLFAPVRGTSAYLIDPYGRLANRWQDPDGYSGGAAMYLTERGTLVRTLLIGNSGRAGAGAGGLIREYDWDGNVIWDFVYDDPTYWTHHDIELLPNGNVLITAFETVVVDETGSCRDADGSINRALAPVGQQWDHIIEVQPDYASGSGGDIVWEWHLCDHLGENDPGKWSGRQNYNSIDYYPMRDHILIGCNACNELFIIDHGTTSEEAQGPAGDFIYRWGNPANFGASGDTVLGGQHTVRFIKSEFGINLGSYEKKKARGKAKRNNVGNIILFNNRHTACETPGCSAVIEITPPYNKETRSYVPPVPGVGFLPTNIAIEIEEIVDESGPRTFFSPFLSSGQRLKEGRYLIDAGAGNPVTEFFETDNAGVVLWKYVPPVATFSPGRSPASDWPLGKVDDICMLANASGLPADPDGSGPLDRATQWNFRATRYAKGFEGFDHVDIQSDGPLLTDVIPFPGEEYGPCPTLD